MMNIKLITETDAMKKPGITSRQTMCNYQIKHGFPRPIRTHPKAYLENAVNQWILNGASTRRFLNVPEKLIEAVNACRAAMLAQPVSRVYKLVPVELTPEMQAAWDGAPNNSDDDTVNMMNAYRAMIAAAPEGNQDEIPKR